MPGVGRPLPLRLHAREAGAILHGAVGICGRGERLERGRQLPYFTIVLYTLLLLHIILSEQRVNSELTVS